MTTITCTGSAGDLSLDRLLHDLDVANDTHPVHSGCTRHPRAHDGYGDDEAERHDGAPDRR